MKIGVAITSYNQCSLLGEAVESCLTQQLPPAWISIVDDASTDDSAEYIRSLAAAHPDQIRIKIHEQNQGVSATRNDAFSLLHACDVTVALDGDDRFYPETLARLNATWSGDAKDYVYGNFLFLDGDGVESAPWATPSDTMPRGSITADVVCFRFPGETLPRHPFVPRTLREEVGPYDTSMHVWEDYEYLIRLARVGNACYVPAVTSGYRKHEGTLSARPAVQHLEAWRHIESRHASWMVRDPNAATMGEVIRKHVRYFAGVVSEESRAPWTRLRYLWIASAAGLAVPKRRWVRAMLPKSMAAWVARDPAGEASS